MVERIPVGGLNAYLWPSRSGVTWGKAVGTAVTGI
jgi:hypothetical protein